MPAPRQWRGDRLLQRTRGNFPRQQCCCPTLRSQLMLAKYATIVRRAGALTAVAAAIMVALSAVLVGVKGLIGALIGVAVVTVFFGISVVVVGRAARISPPAMMLAAIITYLVKIVALAVVVSSVNGTTAFSTRDRRVTPSPARHDAGRDHYLPGQDRGASGRGLLAERGDGLQSPGPRLDRDRLHPGLERRPGHYHAQAEDAVCGARLHHGQAEQVR